MRDSDREDPGSKERQDLTLDDYVDGITAGDRSVLGRALTLVESNRSDHIREAQELLSRLLPHTGEAYRIGITGVPGVGKSTFIEAFGKNLTDDHHRVAVLAIDPSSSVSGGSILGDKTRMPQLAADDRAFIRPSPSAGSLGGVARKTRESILVCEAAGYDVILVETVGVGQSESVAAELVDFFLVLMLAGAGDDLQGIKRGLLELADLLAINKADGENTAPAQSARAAYESALSLMRPPSPNWRPKVLTCSALENRGLGEIWSQIEEHRSVLGQTGELETRRRRQRVNWMWSMVRERLETALVENPEVKSILPDLEEQVLEGELTSTAGATAILEAFGLSE